MSAFADTARVTGRTSIVSTARWLRRYWVAFVAYTALLVIWEVSSRSGMIPQYLLPAPTAVLENIIEDLPVLLEHTQITAAETLLGFAVGSGIGFVLGLAVAYSPLMERLIYPFVVFTQTVPKLALAPLFIVWFGVGMTPKVAITALICLFPVLINTVVGIKSVDQRLLQLMHSVSARRWQTFRFIELPSAMPHIFAGLQVGVTLAVVGALVGEWVGADRGLGYAILVANSQLRTVELFAALVFVTLLGIVLFVAIRLLEAVVLPHRPHLSIRDQTP